MKLSKEDKIEIDKKELHILISQEYQVNESLIKPTDSGTLILLNEDDLMQ